jgi:hypothetical protein
MAGVCAEGRPRSHARAEVTSMFRIYEWTFSATAEMVVGVLLVLTLITMAFV